MKSAGIRKYRSPKAIKNKIINLEESFKNAHDWAGQTGAGVKENDPRSFDEYVLRKCPYYFDLLPVMQDRSNARPLLTSDSIDIDLLQSDSDSNDETSTSTTEAGEEIDCDRNGNNDNNDRGQATNKSNGDGATGNKPAAQSKTQKSTTQKKNDTVIAVIDMQKEAVGMQKEAVAEARRHNTLSLTEATRHNMQMEELKKRELEQALVEQERQSKLARL
jgi:hypothetical protein